MKQNSSEKLTEYEGFSVFDERCDPLHDALPVPLPQHGAHARHALDPHLTLRKVMGVDGEPQTQRGRHKAVWVDDQRVLLDRVLAGHLSTKNEIQN